MNNDTDLLMTKVSLLVATLTGALTLKDWDLIFSLALKFVSIISFMIVIVLNIDKLIKKIKEWLN